MMHIVIAASVAAYGATAVLIGARFWRSLTQDMIDESVAYAQGRLPIFAPVFPPFAALFMRPAWAAAHGLVWPLAVLQGYRERTR